MFFHIFNITNLLTNDKDYQRGITMLKNKTMLKLLVCCTLLTIISSTNMVFADNLDIQFVKENVSIELQEVSPTSLVGYISANNVNLRQGPGTNYTSIRLLAKGTPVVIQIHDGDWTRVRIRDGSTSTGYIIGYVHSAYIEYR